MREKHSVKLWRAAALLASPSLVLPSAPAHAVGQPQIWTEVRTAEGCILYWPRNPSVTEADFRRDNVFSFENQGCQPGSPLSGQGMLMRVLDGRMRLGYRGRVVNGLLEGPVELFADSNTSWSTMRFTGGCGEAGLRDGICRPHSGARSNASAQAGPLGLRNAPAASGPRPEARPSNRAATPGASPNASNDVFEDCVQREGPRRSGIQVMYYLRNACRTRISLSYCLEATFEAAGDYNLCSRREYKTHSVAPGEAVHFAFNLMPPGTGLTDGRTVTNNTLYVRGHACDDNSSPRVHFDNGLFVFRGC